MDQAYDQRVILTPPPWRVFSLRSGGYNGVIDMSEEDRQTAKEAAVLLALQHDMALIRRDLEIHGMHKNGGTERISTSTSYDTLWQDALEALKKRSCS